MQEPRYLEERENGKGEQHRKATTGLLMGDRGRKVSESVKRRTTSIDGLSTSVHLIGDIVEEEMPHICRVETTSLAFLAFLFDGDSVVCWQGFLPSLFLIDSKDPFPHSIGDDDNTEPHHTNAGWIIRWPAAFVSDQKRKNRIESDEISRQGQDEIGIPSMQPCVPCYTRTSNKYPDLKSESVVSLLSFFHFPLAL